MTRAEHAAFIKGLEAARKIANTEKRAFERASNDDANTVSYYSAIGCAWVRDMITQRIRRERKKARAK